MLREKMPSEELATAATLSPTPIARRAFTAWGLMLIPAPTSFSVGDCSNNSASNPRAASAFAVARPANPPPTTAIFLVCVMFLGRHRRLCGAPDLRSTRRLYRTPSAGHKIDCRIDLRVMDEP